jgi:hypothetical protein
MRSWVRPDPAYPSRERFGTSAIRLERVYRMIRRGRS